jgi:hypothetical protein
MMPWTQAIAMPTQHFHRQELLVQFQSIQPFRRDTQKRDHLRGYGPGVFEACHTDRLCFHPQDRRQSQDEIRSREQAFSDFDIEVLTLSARKIERPFLDLEVFRKSPHLSADARQRRCQKRQGHGAIGLCFILAKLPSRLNQSRMGGEMARMVYFSLCLLVQ